MKLFRIGAMVRIENAGEIQATDNCTYFWMLPEYFFYRNMDCVTSPWFSSAGEKWRLVILPSLNGKLRESGSHLSVFLWKKPCHLNFKYNVKFSIKDKKDVDAFHWGGETMSDFGFGKWDFLPVQTAQHLSINGLLKLFCTIVQLEDNIQKDLQINVKESNRKIEIQHDDDKNNESEAKGVDRLLENFKKLLIDGQNSDLVLKAEDREFRVHKGILGARSPVFTSMFQLDMKEKTSGVVDIPDCTAESFEIFLQYIYTGSAKTMSSNSVFNLYYAAEKYHVNDLKEECVQFMRDNMSVENICDVVALSLTHGETGLLRDATNFFRHNVKKIIKTVRWKTYLEGNSTQANDLLIKAFGD